MRYIWVCLSLIVIAINIALFLRPVYVLMGPHCESPRVLLLATTFNNLDLIIVSAFALFLCFKGFHAKFKT